MQLTLIQKQAIHRLVLSTKVNGQFWVTGLDEEGNKKNLVTVEGIDGKWVLKSNKKVEIRDGENRVIKSIAIAPMNFYNLLDCMTGETYSAVFRTGYG